MKEKRKNLVVQRQLPIRELVAVGQLVVPPHVGSFVRRPSLSNSVSGNAEAPVLCRSRSAA